MATRFYLDKRTNKAGESAVIVSVTMYRKRLLTTVGFTIDPKKWDDARQRIKQGANIKLKSETISGEKKAVSYNFANNWLNSIENYFTELEHNITTDIEQQKNLDLKLEFDKEFRGKADSTTKEKTLFDMMDEFVKEQGTINDWTTSTSKIFTALKNHLTNFNDKLTFNDLGEAGLTNFLEYLKTVPLPDEQIGMKNSTLKKHLSYLKWFLRWTIKKKYNTNTDFMEFNPKLRTAQRQVVFLEWDELLHVYNFDFSNNKRLEQARDVFCFSCFTGLRYSDVANMKHSDIIDDEIRITTQKTIDSLTINLNDYSRAILDKYKAETYPYDKALPVISNQKMNDYLKEMAEICGLNAPVTQIHFRGNERIENVTPKYKLISTHTGRRTFISNALMKGIPAEVVMKFTGHSDYDAMKPYIDIAKKAKAEAMEKFNF